MIEKDFIIGKVSWLTQMASEPVLTEEQKSLYRLRYELLFKFLQENKLATKVLLEAGESVTDEHQLKVSDLTETGFKVVKKALPKWEAKIDKAKDKLKATQNLSLLENALTELS